MEHNLERLKTAIKERGDRITKPRLVVYDFLVRNRGHFSAQEVFNGVRSVLPEVTLATVYNVLRYLADIGLIQEIPTHTEVLYDGTEPPHAHLICVECGEVEDLSGVSVTQLLRATRAKGWKPGQNPVSVFATCPECQKRSGKPLL
ncbi:transcriptional repressor [Coprothermobacteraceae bacterium]|nr:transcriptional repressor [Coprothermobacteraceae bacterium]